jgi:hypothetical protein
MKRLQGDTSNRGPGKQVELRRLRRGTSEGLRHGERLRKCGLGYFADACNAIHALSHRPSHDVIARLETSLKSRDDEEAVGVRRLRSGIRAEGDVNMNLRSGDVD